MSQIQALDCTQQGLPKKSGRAGTMTHDYKRHGTTTLFAALNVLDGTVIGHNMKRHRHQEFIRFLNTIEAQVPKREVPHAIVDNYVSHKHPKVRVWLARHPRWTFHFTPTCASWLNAVEGFFAKLTPPVRMTWLGSEAISTAMDFDQCWGLAQLLCDLHRRRTRSCILRSMIMAAMIAVLAAAIVPAEAQVMNLSGEFRCAPGCLGTGPAYVTQNGWDLNIVNEVGQRSRAWIDYRATSGLSIGTRRRQLSDGMTIQFDNGSVWHELSLRRCSIVAARDSVTTPPVALETAKGRSFGLGRG